jgi:hypothetical protein
VKRALVVGGFLAALALGGWFLAGDKGQFVIGGALINLGYRLQDPVANFDFAHEHLAPPQIWDQFLTQNHMAAQVRQKWPRTSRHPVIALVTCMDARLDTNEIAGDTRRYYYVLRLAGSVLSVKEEEMLELAVDNGVEVVVFTTHTDCAAEKASKDPAKRLKYPQLTRAIEEREARFEEFLARPTIREKSASGHLLVKWMDLDTATERVLPHKAAGRAIRRLPNFAEPL